jgi:hypothetical protein
MRTVLRWLGRIVLLLGVFVAGCEFGWRQFERGPYATCETLLGIWTRGTAAVPPPHALTRGV